MKGLDLANTTFGRLTVLYRSGTNKQGLAVWRCRCSCGNEVDLIGSEIKRGKVRSCGCYQKECVRKNTRKENRYDLTGDYGIGYTLKDQQFYFDKEDFDLIKDHCWRLRPDGYLDAKIRDGSGDRVLMHNLIMGQKYVDHKGGTETRNDNRKGNLRVSDGKHSFETYNNINKAIQSNNTSGCPGVAWHKRDQIWEAFISIDHKQIYLGRYRKYEDAVKARLEAEKKYFGQWSKSESQKLKEVI